MMKIKQSNDSALLKDKKKSRVTISYVLYASLIVLCYTPLANLNYYIVLGYSLVLYQIIRLVLFSICAFLIIKSIPELIKEIKIDFGLLLVFFGFAFLLSLMLNFQYVDIYLSLGRGLLFSLFWYFVARSIKDFKLLLRNIEYMSYIILSSSFLLVLVNVVSDSAYNQSLGYMILPACIIFINKLFESFNLHSLLFSWLAFILVLSMGARGPILCILIFIMIKYLVILRENKVLFVGSSLAGLIIIITAYFNFTKITLSLVTFFSSIGLSTRVLMRILHGDLLGDYGIISRGAIAKASYHLIRESHYLGTGLINDRIQISLLLDGGLSKVKGFYSHNLVIEMILQFGIFIGTILLILILFSSFFGIFHTKDRELKQLIHVFFAIGLSPLLVSASYLTYPLFFMFLGFSVNSLELNRKS